MFIANQQLSVKLVLVGKLKIIEFIATGQDWRPKLFPLAVTQYLYWISLKNSL